MTASDATAVRHDHTADQIQQRCLPAAAAAGDRDHAPGCEADAHSVQDLPLAPLGAQLINIHAVGDSITEGVGGTSGDGGYRLALDTPEAVDNLILLDLTGEETIWATNRFTVYAMFPMCDISIHKMWGFQQQNIVFATGKSIIDRGCTTHVGELMLRFGGGGHAAAGTCQIPTDEADDVQKKLVEVIVADHRDKLADD